MFWCSVILQTASQSRINQLYLLFWFFLFSQMASCFLLLCPIFPSVTHLFSAPVTAPLVFVPSNMIPSGWMVPYLCHFWSFTCINTHTCHYSPNKYMWKDRWNWLQINLIDSFCMHIQHHQNIATCIIFRSGKLIFYLLRLTYLISVDWCRLLFLWNYFFILGIRWLREFVKNCFPINKLFIQNGQQCLVQERCI